MQCRVTGYKYLSWKDHFKTNLKDQKIQFLYTAATKNPFEIDPISEHSYGFLFLKSVYEFNDPMKFKIEIEQFFDVIFEYGKEHPADSAFLIERIQTYFPQQDFPDLLGTERRQISKKYLDCFVPVELIKHYGETLYYTHLDAFQKVLFFSFQKYKAFILDVQKENDQKSYGLASWIPFHSHGIEGIEKVKKFIEMISNIKNTNLINDEIRMFFNKKTGLKPHSFISFFLNEIQKYPDLIKKTTLNTVIKNTHINFIDAHTTTKRANALDILHSQGLFNSIL